MGGEGKKKEKEKAQILVRGKLGGGTREAQTMKGKQEETEGRETDRGPWAAALQHANSCSSRRQSDAARGLESNYKY